MRLAVAFGAGFVILHVAASQIVDSRLDLRYEGDSILAVVRVIEFPAVSNKTTTMIVAPVSDTRLPSRSRVTWIEAPVRPALGDTWQFEMRLRRPRSAANPGGFDAERWMFRSRIHASGYVVTGKRNRLLRSPDLGPVDRVRAAVVKASEVAAANRGVIAAVAVGARQEIPAERWDRYAQTGTSHLVAISGLHVGLAAIAAFAVIYAASVIVGNPSSHLTTATIGGVALALTYSVYSGLGVPAQRATLMLSLVATALVFGRKVRPADVLAGCSLLVFFINPVATLSPGFALSFGAVAILYRAAVEHRSGGRISGYVRSLWAAQLFLFFGLLPLTDLFFDRVAIVAPIVNSIVVPVFSLITVPAALAATIAVGFDLPVADWCFRVADIGVHGVEAIVDAAAALPLPGSTITERNGVAVFAPWLATLWILLPRAWPGRILALLAVAVVLQPVPQSPVRGCAAIHVLDVGQGQSVVVRTARHTLVYDTGPAYRSGGSAAEYVVSPFLKYIGATRIDWLVVSHGDLDHAGGVGDLAATIDIGRVFSSEALRLPGLDEYLCRAGQRWRVDDVEFTVLHPENHSGGNDSSCVLEISTGKKRLLLTGDIEAGAEQRLLERGLLEESLIVTVPHHGSQTSSQPGFVNRLNANIAIASTGFRNRWNFPSERVRRRWEGAGARFYDTGVSGALSMTMCRWREPRIVREERYERRRFWHYEASSQ